MNYNCRITESYKDGKKVYLNCNTLVYLVFVILLMPISSTSQENDYLEKTIPPSPTAAALGAYGDNQVSLFSGTPNISIPIFELMAKDISVPISLSYNASGIKVEQTASNVGMGWSLNAGGVITRTIRGLADGLDSNKNLFPSRSYLPIQSPPDVNSFNEIVAASSSQGGGTIDTEPDIFYYNFNGRSGAFYLDAGAKVVMNQYEDLLIEFIRTAPNDYKFMVTTENGTKYEFEDTETTEGEISAWFLTKITNANQTDEIIFNYDLEDYYYFNSPRFSRVYVRNNGSTYPALQEVFPPNLPDQISDRLCRRNSIIGKRLTSIVSSKMGSVEFVRSNTPRSDVQQGGLYGAFPLGEIKIKDIDGNEIKEFLLETSFIASRNTYSHVSGTSLCPVNEDYMNYRMYLDRIVESSEKVHAFEYFGRTAQNEDMLPNRMSAAQDWSGHYNGKNLNQDLVTRFSGYLQGHDNENDLCFSAVNNNQRLPGGYVNISGANREISYPEVTYGTLKSVKYPTGGQTDFTFELHEQSVIGEKGGIRVKNIVNKDVNGAEINRKEYTYQQPLPGYGTDFIAYTYYAGNKPKAQRLAEIPYCDFLNQIGDNSSYDDHIEAVKLNAGSFNDLGAFNGNHMGYAGVVESQTGNGHTAYSYSGFAYSDSNGYDLTEVIYGSNNAPGGVAFKNSTTYGGNWPAIPNNDSSWKRGILKGKAIFDANGLPVKREQYVYEHIETDGIPGIKILTSKSDEAYIYSEYTFPSGWNKLTGQKTYSYDRDTGEEMVTNETYEYNGVDHKQITKSTIERSNGEIIETDFVYPPDITSISQTNTATVDAMKYRHMISPVLRKEVEQGGLKLEGQITNFDLDSGKIVKKSIEILEKEGNYEDRAEFVAYDSFGNLLEQKLTDGSSVCFVWGYQDQYPIAQIQNASYNTMTSAQLASISDAQDASDLDFDNCKSITCDEQLLREELSDLHEVFPDAQVITYTYDPLIGVTSITDQRDNTNYFRYDNLNRLIEVKDTDENIVTDYKYYYRAQ